jgi:hypothetical protein
MYRFLACALGCLLAAGPAAAQIIPFDLMGKGGPGLLSGNQVDPVAPVPAPGSGGEVGPGITFDMGTGVLTINIAWGSANGFTDLTGPAAAGHVHGPTLDPMPVSFNENAAVKYPIDPLPGWNNSASSGGFAGTVNIVPGDVPGLLAGQFYINVHTATNPNGEIRGQLVPVPEPSALLLGAFGAIGFVRLRRARA